MESANFDLSANIEWYCGIWREFFPNVAGWDAERTEEFVEKMKIAMQDETAWIFHEESFTWAVWAVLPHREGMSPQRVEQARNKLINFTITQRNSRGGTDGAIDWRIVGHAYRELLNELEQPNSN